MLLTQIQPTQTDMVTQTGTLTHSLKQDHKLEEEAHLSLGYIVLIVTNRGTQVLSVIG